MDEEYKEATKAVVDDAMRDDTLGPNVLRIIQNHKPVNDEIVVIVAKAIKGNPDVANELNVFIDSHSTNQKGRWVERGIIIAAATVLTLLITYAVNNIRIGP